MKRKGLVALGAVGSVLLFAIVYLNMATAAPDAPVQPAGDKAWNRQQIDTSLSLLQTGDIAFRMGIGVYSLLLARINQTNKSYSHCGIVVREHGYPFIYHCVGGEDEPLSGIRRDSAASFFSPHYNTAIGLARYNFTTDNRQALIAAIDGLIASRPTFDIQFDLRSDDKLYCTEFAYKAITRAVADTNYLPTTTVAGNRFVSTDNLFINSNANMIWQVKFK